MDKWQSHSDPMVKRQEREEEASMSRGQEALAGSVTSPVLGKAGGTGRSVWPRASVPPRDGSRVMLLHSPGCRSRHTTLAQGLLAVC